jgi:hypothetical protein
LRAAAALLLLALLPAPLLRAQATAKPRYADVLEAELRALQLAPECYTESATRYVCRYRARSSLTERDLWARAVYSDETDTVYVHIESYLQAPADNPKTATLLRRMMELNWEMLVGKFEWNPRTGEVRLGAVLSTDSNFDRRAFRSLVRTLDTLSARHRAQLAALL